MNSRFCLVSSLLTASLLLSTTDPAQAQLTGTKVDSFEHVNQPIPIRVAVTSTGIGLMGLELWWFLFSRAKAKTDESSEIAFAGNAQHDLVDTTPDDKPSATPDPSAVPKVEPEVASGQTELAHSARKSQPRQFVTSFCSIYNGVEMARGVLMVECKMQPTFSAA